MPRPGFIVFSSSPSLSLIFRSLSHARLRPNVSCGAGSLYRVTSLPTEIDVLEDVIRETVDHEASWLETQYALLRRAQLLLRPGSDAATHDQRTMQVEDTLRLVSAAFRERLTSLDSTAAALRLE